MEFLFLDVAQGGLVGYPFVFLAHVIFTLAIEGFILYRFKYNTLKKSYIGVFLANLVSLIVGLFIFTSLPYYYFESLVLFLLLLLGLTIVIELLILRLYNKSFKLPELAKAVIVMNVVTYIPLYFIFQMTGMF